MLAYKLNDTGEVEQAENLDDYADWYYKHKDELIIARDDVLNYKDEPIVIITRFRGQTGPHDDPRCPLVWVTEGTDGDFFGATSTKAQAIEMHKSTVRMVKSRYQNRTTKEKKWNFHFNIYKK